MKIVKSTFQDVLEEVEKIFFRIDIDEGNKLLSAGGINKSGVWIEFVSTSTSIYNIEKRLKIMIYLVEREKKCWSQEKHHHAIIREYKPCLN